MINIENKFPQRARIRLPNYDYSLPGAYFLTICTADGRNYFWDKEFQTEDLPDICITNGFNDGRGDHRSPDTTGTDAAADLPQNVELSRYGEIADEAINNIPTVYSALRLDSYVIMPNHIHLLLSICTDESGRPMVSPTISRVVNQLKGYVSKRVGCSIWQKSYFDHVIRNREDYEKHVEYIYENPVRWREDELYTEK